jgi:hypothetical protein
MKTFGLPLLLALILLAPACEKFQPSRYYRGLLLDDTSSDNTPPAEEPCADTNVYVSAVLVPESYDWRRDTACGAVKCEIALYLNNEMLFSTDAGPGTFIGANPSTHHIIDGHLYTEYASDMETIISMDGTVMFRYPEPEVLSGMIVRPGEMFTIGRHKGGNGFSFRRNGEIIIRQPSGKVFGDFSDSAYGETGALYEDEGKVCFCFKDSRSCYKVADGVMTQIRLSVSAEGVVDMRILNSDLYYIADYSRATMIFSPQRTLYLPTAMEHSDLKITVVDGAPYLLADLLNPARTVIRSLQHASDETSGVSFDGNYNFVIRRGGPYFSVSGQDGLLTLSKEGGENLYARDSTFFFGRSCVVAEGEDAFLVVNPKERECVPFVWHDGKESFFGISGFLTGIAVSVSPPS